MLSEKGRKAISKAAKKMWAKKKHEKLTTRTYRSVETEQNKVITGQSAALSSKQMVFYHDIPPVLFRRVGLRCMVGHKKYNDDPIPITMNLNWRIGLDDPLYMMDRVNHMIEHMVAFLEDGNSKDDNLGAIALMAGWLMECERMHPEVFNKLWGQSRYSGKAAENLKKELQDESGVTHENR